MTVFIQGRVPIVSLWYLISLTHEHHLWITGFLLFHHAQTVWAQLWTWMSLSPSPVLPKLSIYLRPSPPQLSSDWSTMLLKCFPLVSTGCFLTYTVFYWSQPSFTASKWGYSDSHWSTPVDRHSVDFDVAILHSVFSLIDGMTSFCSEKDCYHRHFLKRSYSRAHPCLLRFTWYLWTIHFAILQLYSPVVWFALCFYESHLPWLWNPLLNPFSSSHLHLW